MMKRLYDDEDLVSVCRRKSLEDPLRWSKVHKTKYPTVWLLAKYYLGIGATAANAERCFSYTNRLLDPTRTQTTTQNAEDTYFVNRNFDLLPSSPLPNK
jgi:hypothetical protein